MAKKETKNEPKDLIEAVPEEISKIESAPEILEIAKANEKAEPVSEEAPAEEPMRKRISYEEMKKQREAESDKRALDAWIPKTKLGREVKAGKIKDFDSILSQNLKILESPIVDTLLKLQTDLLLIGQAKGKFGGGKRRAWRQTQRKTMEGNVVTFSCLAVVGDSNGHVGIGMGKAKETLPARAKAFRQAKLNVIRVNRGFETKEENKDNPHTVPFKVEGKCGSVRIKLLPAPRGTGLVAGDECKKILRLAGIKDVYSVTEGQTRTTFNVAKACIDALIKTNKMKL